MSQPANSDDTSATNFDPVSGAAADLEHALPDVTTHPKTGKTPPSGGQFPTPPSAVQSTKGPNHY